MPINVQEVIGLSLKEEELRDTLTRLAFFAPSGSGQYTRELHEFLVLQSLSILPAEQQSARQVHNKVVELIGPKFEFQEILDALNRLSATNSLRCTTYRADDPLARFLIPIETRNDMRAKVEAEEQLELEVLVKWQEEITKEHPAIEPTWIDTLTRDLKSYAIKLLSQHSMESIEIYYGDDASLMALLERLQSTGTSDIWEDRGEEYNAIRVTHVTSFFRGANGTRKQYISSLMHSLFILQLTHLDPQCAAIMRTQIKGGTLYGLCHKKVSYMERNRSTKN